MKQFLVFIGKIMMLLLLVAFALDFGYTYIYINSLPQNKVQYINSLKNRKVNYIFLGSSRVENAIIADEIEKRTNKTAINLGVKGLKLKDIACVIKLLDKNNVSYDKIFIQVDYSYNIEEDYSKFFSYELLPFINSSNLVITDYLRSTNDNYVSNKYIPFLKYTKSDELIGFRKAIALLNNKASIFDFNKGYVPLVGTFSMNREEIPEKLNTKNKYFKEVDLFLKIKKINVVYFSAPVSPITSNLDYFEKLKKNVPNIENLYDVIREEKYFYDNLHVNHDGAVVFTNILIDRLNL